MQVSYPDNIKSGKDNAVKTNNEIFPGIQQVFTAFEVGNF